MWTGTEKVLECFREGEERDILQSNFFEALLTSSFKLNVANLRDTREQQQIKVVDGKREVVDCKRGLRETEFQRPGKRTRPRSISFAKLRISKSTRAYTIAAV